MKWAILNAPIGALASASLALVMHLAPATGSAETLPALWGYGVRPCSAFLAASPGEGTPTPIADEDYLRYREWLAGLVTGLNLATGRDVLRGAEIDAALARIQVGCRDHPADDFFNASLRLLRSLGQVSAK